MKRRPDPLDAVSVLLDLPPGSHILDPAVARGALWAGVRGWAFWREPPQRAVRRAVEACLRDGLEANVCRQVEEALEGLPDEVALELRRLASSGRAVRGGSGGAGPLKPSGGDPPCVAWLKERAGSGAHLTHYERFALASWLLNAEGLSPEEAVEWFRLQEDFDEKKTLYQLRHIAGEAGGGKRYRFPSCEKIRSWGIYCSPDECPLRRKRGGLRG